MDWNDVSQEIQVPPVIQPGHQQPGASSGPGLRRILLRPEAAAVGGLLAVFVLFSILQP
jgi:hypothetical protein